MELDLRRWSFVPLLVAAACGGRTHSGEGSSAGATSSSTPGSTGVTSSSGVAVTSTESTRSDGTSAVATTTATSTQTSAASDAWTWQEYLCGGNPCDPQGTPPWPEGGVGDGDAGPCPPLGS